jgi:hypothetical protein
MLLRGGQIALALALLAGCDMRLRLGDEADAARTADAAASDVPTMDASGFDSSSPVGPPDAGVADIGVGDQGGVIPSGSYQFTPFVTPMVACRGALSGRESDFAGVRTATLGFESGQLQVRASSASIDLSGAPIQRAYGTPSITLTPHAGGQMPPPGYLIAVDQPTLFGPDATMLGIRILAVVTTSLAPGRVGGEIDADYFVAQTDSSCAVQFTFDLIAF